MDYQFEEGLRWDDGNGAEIQEYQCAIDNNQGYLTVQRVTTRDERVEYLWEVDLEWWIPPDNGGTIFFADGYAQSLAEAKWTAVRRYERYLVLQQNEDEIERMHEEEVERAELAHESYLDSRVNGTY